MDAEFQATNFSSLLVIAVAIVRPGPIQGDMIHPTSGANGARSRCATPHSRPSRARRAAGHRRRGLHAGGGRQLRRAMATLPKLSGGVTRHRERLVEGMLQRGYERAFAVRVFQQIEGFSGQDPRRLLMTPAGFRPQ